MNSDSVSNKAKEIFEDVAMVLNGYIQNREKKEDSLFELQLAQIASISNLLSICIANFCASTGNDLQDILKDIIPVINKMSYDQHKEKVELINKLEALVKRREEDPISALKDLFEFMKKTSIVH